MDGEEPRWAGASVDARRCADNVGAWERLEMGRERTRGQSVDARMCPDGVGARETGRSEHRCVDVCGWCGVQGKGWKWAGRRAGKGGNGWGEGRVAMSER